ncbi:mandelate racemase/muconate lactonizing enzyme family protein [Nocardioides sp. AE5]|uniref:mandelate racemase/muconate lactonizing enzyme family protein n=1 Tax=Nocardioides sp. AE5 TaxID=2962573 RepID=UPI0028811C14|nr:mandelate racemase/muconate lactonizing enzyme family protein [Nocardioides sp. AE5]MDT0203157.1 mandelate racemase/muconate lactonizing enzyme family protein [Nocardioides sp. AE5]
MTIDPISTIAAYPLIYEEPHYRGARRCVTLARIETRSGVVGWGESISQIPEAALATAVIIDRGLAATLVGEDARDVTRLWSQMCRHAYWYGVEGIAGFAISALDMALWDLAGHLAGRPVTALIGDIGRRRVPAMGSVIFDMLDLDATLEEFRFMRDAGYPILKAGWGMTSEAMFGQDAARDDVYLRAVRDLIGPDLGLVVDVPGAQRLWDLKTAMRRLKDWEPHGLRWVEQPLHPAELENHRILRAHTTTPVGTGEDEWSPESYGHVLRAGAADVIQIDPGRCLGLTGALRVIREIESAGVNYSMHSWSSALNTAASLALLSVSDHGDTLDFKPHESPMQHDLVTDPWELVDGHLELRERPGLGVTVEPSQLERFRLS